MVAYVYILCNRRNGTLYTGVTTDIAFRMMQHREGTGSKFCARWGIRRLVYVETHESLDSAIPREKRIKRWNRAWKIELIEGMNPDWRDLFFDLNR